MQPTVNEGDYLIVERLSIISGYIKRVKGLEDDRITFWDNSRWEIIVKEVPLGHVWLEGDNALRSLDSRSYGPVPVSRLEYKVLLRVWPLKQFGRLKTPKSVTCKSDEPNDLGFVQLSVRQNDQYKSDQDLR
ncbi:unnamed protein product [Heterobilharzia americana]|nr:unnamed protein product [Heterobilharzia americana]